MKIIGFVVLLIFAFVAGIWTQSDYRYTQEDLDRVKRGERRATWDEIRGRERCVRCGRFLSCWYATSPGGRDWYEHCSKIDMLVRECREKINRMNAECVTHGIIPHLPEEMFDDEPPPPSRPGPSVYALIVDDNMVESQDTGEVTVIHFPFPNPARSSRGQ